MQSKVEVSGQKESRQYVPRGSICDRYNLYQTKPDEEGNTGWSKHLPNDLVDTTEDSDLDQYALTVRQKKCYDGRKALEIHSIVVQSEPLKRFLQGVLSGYGGLTLTLERLEFEAPFGPFVHRWEQFTQARAAEQDPTTRAHVDLLYEVLEEELHDVISRKNDLVRNGVITYDFLWTIYEPEAVVVSTLHHRQCGLVFRSSYFNKRISAIVLVCEYVDWDGDNFGRSSYNLTVPPFVGTSPIMSLPAIPLVFHPDQNTVRRDLIARGKLWEELSGYHYKDYEGLATSRFDNREYNFKVKGRIIIDTEAYNTFNSENEVMLEQNISGLGLSDEQRLVATPVVRGYSLNDKRWLEFYVDGVKEIVWNTKAFDSLVLPESQRNLKQLVLAFAKAHSKTTNTFDDVIQGKGRGVIMLLSGPPGVGKTLTAESVAEVMRVPLYVLSAGSLGTDASDVEDKLKDVFRMIPKWGAVLLLDEADVFMETRSTSDLQRNELVSIFLRLLEYYEVSLNNLNNDEERQLTNSLGSTLSNKQPRRQYRPGL